jgi:DNA-binding IclR family transcriptional regulator
VIDASHTDVLNLDPLLDLPALTEVNVAGLDEVAAARFIERRPGVWLRPVPRAGLALSVIVGNPGLSVTGLAQLAGISPSYIYRLLPELMAERLVERRDRGWWATAIGLATAEGRDEGDSGRAQRAAAKARQRRRNDDRAFDLVQSEPGITIPQIAEALGVPPNYLYRVMPKLASDGLVRRDGQRWHPVDEAEQVTGRPAGPARKTTTRRRTARDRRVLELVRERPGITIPDIAAELKIEPNYLYRVIPKLESDGLVRRDGQGWHPGDSPRVRSAGTTQSA